MYRLKEVTWINKAHMLTMQERTCFCVVFFCGDNCNPQDFVVCLICSYMSNSN